ncbi:hypothetical protein BO221_30220 [Archangium sp. Cb G35]|uniref:hypothetical protein n=1 Tax=Archangium sp. Cb G35 TaxID=1920190 RepID=UPI0009362B1B|nr:hypothetical protein [Archangium sp. Cb G35]OJT20317.1 hypothetical protein BO221_30220 [Archangium sp. Cb G35]
MVIHLIHVTEQGIHKNVFCPIEVQVPEVNYLGVVTDQFAQWEAARAADIAAERTLKQQHLLSAELCQRFMAEMLDVMGDTVDGARVIKAL